MKENEQPVYTGWRKWTPTPEEWGEFYASSQSVPPFEMKENEYLLVYSEENGEPRLCQQYCCEKGRLRKFSHGSIAVSKKRDADSKVIYPRNDEQVCAFDLMLDRKKPVKVLLGSFGSGKTMLGIYAALQALYRGQFDRIIYIRNNVKVAGSFDIGFLKGELLDKMAPWLAPISDHIGKDALMSLISSDRLAVEPLATLRGRNFAKSIIFVDECENLLLSNVKLILGRCAEDSEVWFLGDLRQKDLESFEKSKGVENLIEYLKGNPLFGYVFLPKSERSEVAKLADLFDKVLD